jgi:hypothetical protein
VSEQYAEQQQQQDQQQPCCITCYKVEVKSNRKTAFAAESSAQLK